jgi:hypothetical protein
VGQVLGLQGQLPEVFTEVRERAISGWMDLWREGGRGGWMDRWMDGWMDGWISGGREGGMGACVRASPRSTVFLRPFHTNHTPHTTHQSHQVEISYYLLRRLLGVKTQDGGKQAKVQKLAPKEILMVNIGSTATGGKVLALREDAARREDYAKARKRATERLACLRGLGGGGRSAALRRLVGPSHPRGRSIPLFYSCID